MVHGRAAYPPRQDLEALEPCAAEEAALGPVNGGKIDGVGDDKGTEDCAYSTTVSIMQQQIYANGGQAAAARGVHTRNLITGRNSQGRPSQNTPCVTQRSRTYSVIAGSLHEVSASTQPLYKDLT